MNKKNPDLLEEKKAPTRPDNHNRVLPLCALTISVQAFIHVKHRQPLYSNTADNELTHQTMDTVCMLHEEGHRVN